MLCSKGNPQIDNRVTIPFELSTFSKPSAQHIWKLSSRNRVTQYTSYNRVEHWITSVELSPTGAAIGCWWWRLLNGHWRCASIDVNARVSLIDTKRCANQHSAMHINQHCLLICMALLIDWCSVLHASIGARFCMRRLGLGIAHFDQCSALVQVNQCGVQLQSAWNSAAIGRVKCPCCIVWTTMQMANRVINLFDLSTF